MRIRNTRYDRGIGYATLFVVLVFSALLATSPDGVGGVPSWMLWLVAATAGVVLVVSLLVQYWPSLKLLFRSPDWVDKHIRDAEWYMQHGDIDEAWQLYIKAKLSAKHLPAERRRGVHAKLLVLFGELKKVSEGPIRPRKSKKSRRHAR